MSKMPEGELTEERCKQIAETGWWLDLPEEEVFRWQAQNPLCMDFSEFHRIAEDALCRPVWTHEFSTMDRLLAELDGDEEKPENYNQHAMDSLAALMLEHGKDPDEHMITVETIDSDQEAT